MKAMIVLLAIAVAFAYGAPPLNLKSISETVKILHQKTLNTEVFDSVFVKDLKKNKTDNCEVEFFCQARLILSGIKLLKEYDTNHVDKLLRNLKEYHNGVNCSVPTTGDEILLRSFLDDLLKCTKMVYSKNR